MKDMEKSALQMIEKASHTLLSYVDDNGFPVTRTINHARERDGIKVFWFSTNTSSNKVKCLLKNNKASLYFCDKRELTGVSLQGTLEILETNEFKERIWRDGDTKYYPEGVHDPDYSVMRFTTTSMRIFNAGKSTDLQI